MPTTEVPPEPPVFFLAIDPGLTTGWAGLHEGSFTFGEIRGRFDFYEALRWWTSAGAVPEIVIEGWEYDRDTHKKSRQEDAWKIIGYVEGLAKHNGWAFEVQPRQKRKFADDAKLRALGWEATTKDGHAREAARHLLTYLTRRYGKPGELGHDLLLKIMESTDGNSPDDA